MFADGWKASTAILKQQGYNEDDYFFPSVVEEMLCSETSGSFWTYADTLSRLRRAEAQEKLRIERKDTLEWLKSTSTSVQAEFDRVSSL